MEELFLVSCIFTKSNTPPWVFFHVFKIVQKVPNRPKRLICRYFFLQRSIFKKIFNCLIREHIV